MFFNCFKKFNKYSVYYGGQIKQDQMSGARNVNEKVRN